MGCGCKGFHGVMGLGADLPTPEQTLAALQAATVLDANGVRWWTEASAQSIRNQIAQITCQVSNKPDDPSIAVEYLFSRTQPSSGLGTSCAAEIATAEMNGVHVLTEPDALLPGITNSEGTFRVSVGGPFPVVEATGSTGVLAYLPPPGKGAVPPPAVVSTTPATPAAAVPTWKKALTFGGLALGIAGVVWLVSKGPRHRANR
jgi:hypothetical protein